MSDNEVRTRMAEGKIFVGEQAKEAGLVDEIGSFQDALEYVRVKTVDGLPAAKLAFELIPNTEPIMREGFKPSEALQKP